jgi:cytochrome P450
LILGGSETTATALSSATYYLGLNPEPFKRLCDEVRSAFKTEEEIDILSVGRLEYMPAVLNEAMRMNPPISGTIPRTINQKGDEIAGYFVPPGVSTIPILKHFHSHLYMSCYRPMLISGFGLHVIFPRTGPSLRGLSPSDG